MPENVKAGTRRPYNAQRRREQAAATRAEILKAAGELFVERGYAASTVGQIAERAAVAVDTIYAAVGRKPDLLRELVETALSGTDRAVPAEEREYVHRIREATDARDKLRIYAAAISEIGQRMGPIHTALREAAVSDPPSAQLRAEISARRAANMRLFAAELRATGQLRPDLSDEEVADIVWSMNAAEYFALLVGERGWSADRFRDWLYDAWARTLLAGDA